MTYSQMSQPAATCSNVSQLFGSVQPFYSNGWNRLKKLQLSDYVAALWCWIFRKVPLKKGFIKYITQESHIRLTLIHYYNLNCFKMLEKFCYTHYNKVNKFISFQLYPICCYFQSHIARHFHGSCKTISKRSML